jgi:hypothetical protein
LVAEGLLSGRLCLETRVEVVKPGTPLAPRTAVRVVCIVRAVRADESEAGVLETVRLGVAIGANTQPPPKDWLLTGVVEVQVCETVTIVGRADAVRMRSVREASVRRTRRRDPIGRARLSVG